MPRTVTKDEFSARKDALWSYLTENKERELAWESVKTAVAKLTGVPSLTDPQLEYCIRRLRKELQGRSEIKIIGANLGEETANPKKNAYIILHHRESEFARRDREAKQQKMWMGHAAWYVLLGKCWEPEGDDSSPAYLIMPKPVLWPSDVHARLKALRKRTYVSVAVDSGSSIRALARCLVDKPVMPFEAYDAPLGCSDSREAELQLDGKSTKYESRLVLPNLITNSPLVVCDILESRNYNRLEVRLVGGNVVGDSASTCGGLSELCLSSWGYAGNFIGVDLAIVGTRGYMSDVEGQKGFTVSHLNQAAIKSRFFSMAATRCIIMSSRKLRHPDGVCRFARLNSKDVHLVITDSECEAEAISFFVESCKAGVIPIIADDNGENAARIARCIDAAYAESVRSEGDHANLQAPKVAISEVGCTAKPKT